VRACAADYVYASGYAGYDFGPEHPLRPERCRALFDLLRETRLLRGRRVRIVEPPPAADEDLLLAHSAEYIDTVHALSDGAQDRARAEAAGLGEGDTPAFAGMHEAAALLVGGTLHAVRSVMRGETAHAFNPGGGLHHALRARASGFCIYNDLAVAIAAVVQEFGTKVLYLDFDVHHGDGVQAAFYDDPRVLTLSFHETGKYLFPGSGEVLELGTRAGLGCSVNVPLAPFTQDDSWLAAVEGLVPGLAEQFAPDLIVSQFGCDAHTWDGQAHLRLTTRAYARAARLVHELAHTHCGGRWVATGGGGYDAIRVVPRAWTLVWAEMIGRTLPEALPPSWLERWRPDAAGEMPHTFVDPAEIVTEIPRRAAIERENAATVARVRGLALSPRLRQAYRQAGSWSPSVVRAYPPGRTRTLDLPQGRIYLRDRAPRSLVRRLRVAAGLQAFSRDAGREAQLLQSIAGRAESNLVLAYTPDGEIAAELTLAPADGRWFGVDGLYETALQVAPHWRGSGLAEALLRFTFEAEYTEQLVVLALGLSWHWDLQGVGLTASAYRDRLTHLFGTAGFQPYTTDDEEIMASEFNVLLARVGANAPHELYEAFYQRLYRRHSWLGI
jgi:acetoin utilization deacetylase AcuC-like enzyme